MGLIDRIRHSWNVFTQKEPTGVNWAGGTYGGRPNYRIARRYSDKAMVSHIFNRISLDASMVEFSHIKVDPDDDSKHTYVKSGLIRAITEEANIDQTGRQLIQDIVYSMFDEGVVAVVPVDTTTNPREGSYDINTLRVGRITQWYSKNVRVQLYNEETGMDAEVIVPKKDTAIIVNPLSEVINDPNSTLQRLIDKLALLDMVDNIAASGKLDILVQVPYTIKSTFLRKQAEDRLRSLEDQLANNKYGIAYIDGSEKVTQLNRSAVNNLLEQVNGLREELNYQLGITKPIIDGTATELQMRLYYGRTVDPILTHIVEEMNRKFITKTARTQGQKLSYRRDPFKLVEVEQLAEIVDKFLRNEVLTPNEVRPILGFGPSKDDRADLLLNRNVATANQADDVKTGSAASPDTKKDSKEPEENQNGGE